MNKKYLLSSIFWFVIMILFFLFIGISIYSFYITSLIIMVFCYLSALGISIYIEVWILGNKRSWWMEVIFIFFVRLPHFIELIISQIYKRKGTPREILKLIEQEELPLFLCFTSFLRYYKNKKIDSRIVELGIFSSNIHLGLLRRMSFLGFKLKQKYTYQDKITAYKMQWGHSTVMLYIINKKRNRFIKYSFDPDIIRIYSDFPIELKEYKFNDVLFMGPKNPLNYLRHYYGTHWKITYPDIDLHYGPNIYLAEKTIQTKYSKRTSYL